MKKHLGGKVLFLLFSLERAWRESQNSHKLHLPWPSLLMVPPGACHKLPQCWRALMGLIHHKHSLNASEGAPTLLMLYSPFLVTLSPRPTYFFLFSSLKKPTWARKSPSQEEVAWWLLRDRIWEAVSVSCLSKSYNLLAESWSPTSHGPEQSQLHDESTTLILVKAHTNSKSIWSCAQKRLSQQ